ncbi:MAG: DUF1326 domain-containing protein [Vicinamibacterales bacterium]
MRTLLVALSLSLVVVAQPSTAGDPSWHITATVAESCACTISCPCNFGGEPNHDPCEGNRLIAIKSGHYEDVDLSGVSFLITFTMRSWSKIYVSDKVSAKQMAAVEALLPIAFAGFHKGMLSFTKAPITMDITESRVRFSGPESSVDMEVMRGFGGKPVTILNLPNPAYQGYTQYRSVSHQHKSADHAFSHSGTNGFTSTMDVGTKK